MMLQYFPNRQVSLVKMTVVCLCVHFVQLLMYCMIFSEPLWLLLKEYGETTNQVQGW